VYLRTSIGSQAQPSEATIRIHHELVATAHFIFSEIYAYEKLFLSSLHTVKPCVSRSSVHSELSFVYHEPLGAYERHPWRVRKLLVRTAAQSRF